jgi:hypothetical protein
MLLILGLPVEPIKPILNPSCQSDEDNNPDNKNGQIVKVPEYQDGIVSIKKVFYTRYLSFVR